MSSINIFYLEGNLICSVFKFLSYYDINKIICINKKLYWKASIYREKYKKELGLIFEQPKMVHIQNMRFTRNISVTKYKLSDLLEFSNPSQHTSTYNIVKKYNIPFCKKKDELNKKDYLTHYFVEDLSIVLDTKNNIYLKKNFYYRSTREAVYKLKKDVKFPIEFIFIYLHYEHMKCINFVNINNIIDFDFIFNKIKYIYLPSMYVFNEYKKLFNSKKIIDKKIDKLIKSNNILYDILKNLNNDIQLSRYSNILY